jgi:hypothetical protein
MDSTEEPAEGSIRIVVCDSPNPVEEIVVEIKGEE